MRKPTLWVVAVSIAIAGGTLRAQETRKEVVFDGDKKGENAKGWTHAPLGKATIAAQDKEVRASGKKAVEFHAAGKDYMGSGWNWFGWWPQDGGTDISPYKNLRFWAKVTGEKKPSQLTASLKSSDKTASEADDLLRRCPDLLDGKWHELVIPIKDLDSKNALNRAKAWEIQFDTWSQDEINFSLFVDEIGFDGVSGPAASRPAAGPSAEPAAPIAEPVQVATAPRKPLAAGSSGTISEQIMVDQFGFRPQSEKIVIFASPQQGQNAGTKYTPPAKAAVRRQKGGATVLTVDLKPWGGGKTDPTSGDKVWYADISALQTPGAYYVYDAENRLRSTASALPTTCTCRCSRRPSAPTSTSVAAGMFPRPTVAPGITRRATLRRGKTRTRSFISTAGPKGNPATSTAAGTTPATTTSTCRSRWT